MYDLFSEHKFDVGDKVYIAECTDNIDKMQKLIGQIVTIAKVTSGRWTDGTHRAYKIVEDGEAWFWQENWLRSAETPEEEPVTITDEEIDNLFLLD